MESRLAILSVFLGVAMVCQGAFALDPSKYEGGFYDGYALSTASEYYELDGSLPITLAKYAGGLYDGYAVGTSAPDQPLPIVLASLAAQGGDGAVTLQWVTGSEMDNLGFHVYRALSEEGAYERMTSELIQGAGTSTGWRTYRFRDVRLTNGVTYWYKIEDVAFDGTRTMHGPVSVTPQVEEEPLGVRELPAVFDLSQSFPNPFNPVTEIRYQLPEPGYVRLGIYDLLGREAKVLVSERQGAGWYRVTWDGRDEAGQLVSSGVYLYRLEAGSFIETRKALLVR